LNRTSVQICFMMSSPLTFLKPHGAVRGLNPFSPYAVEPNSHAIQCLDFRKQYVLDLANLLEITETENQVGRAPKARSALCMLYG
jgi:hypothetical protein